MAQTQAAQHKHLPGDLAVWFFIFAELAVFGILFIGFGVARSLAPATFSAGRAALHPWTGLINTIGLITASYLVACAVKRLRHEKTGTTALLVGAIAASSIYTFGKLWEYGVLYADGYNLGTDTFFMFYFFLTFFHFMHVVLGQIILVVLAVKVRKGDYHTNNMNGMESGASYWHMVDLVWLVLFPMLYVLA
ncbi:cytochrome c oxidase subunit 3 [Marinobacter persicus]|uniref:Nitric oxide reductase NorE protein n=1 Tax=Marinobacter persicus TaxID=930118 RepID=A0A2S6GAF4_9GAMM|nr:cytochrome c oxidase subunit 3 [Marinobacter persicus]PPK53501.1 nitric oxide reductase NorE protein [Marinobacter persicus]PPK56315.1 nitric oxide reductase NorE protein [Marinobacter persicus]PPK59888.1 nitric oxide reductase NorE protein [Marinobacter persicus]